MAKISKLNRIKQCTISIIIFLLMGCANQLPPGGGDVDKIPPEIINIFPENGTTNFKDDYFEIEFSEYVDKRSVQEAIFISPEIEQDIEYDWSGKSLEVYIGDSLKENTTYTVTIGSGVVDLNNKNPMDRAVNFAFSTGPKIDRGEITGKVYDKDPAGITLSAYKISKTKIKPTEEKPDYRSQVGANGQFKFLGLSPGTYRVFALRDAFRDFIYNIEEDGFGVPFTDVELTEEDTVFNNLNFKLSREDTTKPNLLNLTMTDKYHFLIEFSEFIDSSKLTVDNFKIVDSTTAAEFDIKYLFKGNAKPKNLYLVIEDSLNAENENYLISERIFDLSGNLSEYQSTPIAVNSNPDTTVASIKSVASVVKNSDVDFDDPKVKVILDDAVDFKNLKPAIKILDEKEENVFPFELSKIDDALFQIKVQSKLEPRKEYKIKFDLNYFSDAAGNKLDSIRTLKFKTFNNLEYTGASGKVIVETNHPVILVLESAKDKEIKYYQTADQNSNFNFERLIGSQYLLWSFIDKDSNGVYSFGKVEPFEPSEQFVYYPDTLNLRPRWPVGDIILDYPAK